jgi:hypothetical protein
MNPSHALIIFIVLLAIWYYTITKNPPTGPDLVSI